MRSPATSRLTANPDSRHVVTAASGYRKFRQRPWRSRTDSLLTVCSPTGVEGQPTTDRCAQTLVETGTRSACWQHDSARSAWRPGRGACVGSSAVSFGGWGGTRTYSLPLDVPGSGTSASRAATAPSFCHRHAAAARSRGVVAPGHGDFRRQAS